MFSEIKIYPENNADVLGIGIYKNSKKDLSST